MPGHRLREMGFDSPWVWLGVVVLLGLGASIGYGTAIQGAWFDTGLAIIISLGSIASWLRHRSRGPVARAAADELIIWLALALLLCTGATWPWPR